MKFKIPYINPIVFEIILKYIYTGEVDITGQSRLIVFELLVASDELLLEELFEHVRDYLIEKQAIWIQENFVLVLRTVFKLASYKKLQNYCIETICADPQPFFTSKNFLSLNKVSLYNLLRRNDLQIDEIDIWDCLIKWGIGQTPGFGIRNSDRTMWNKKSYEALKKTLNHFIPLIRFVEISSNDYFDKVRPYKAIIPDRIYEEIEEFYFKDTRNMKINRVVNSSYAIYDHSGMNGINFGGGDLVLENDYLTLSRSGNYENLRKNRFEFLDDSYKNQYGVEEIEAFSVVKI
ncbi:hypothetical protein RhiirC2_863780 [Rhizophagus irregularis]|uniref:BTB domain-containing protein n=1 Tax=Rhizophagus irregularis TaxID=588596 RepID=A0A2N1NKT9_9GLOM|nr:hypothetical protein RhiirC2_863780 [Rhizophagus irregularis]